MTIPHDDEQQLEAFAKRIAFYAADTDFNLIRRNIDEAYRLGMEKFMPELSYDTCHVYITTESDFTTYIGQLFQHPFELFYEDVEDVPEVIYVDAHEGFKLESQLERFKEMKRHMQTSKGGKYSQVADLIRGLVTENYLPDGRYLIILD